VISYWKPVWEYRWEPYPALVITCPGIHVSIPGAYCLTCETEIK
jgi:uncharacterized membrane protein YjjB (DUF3815 family)